MTIKELNVEEPELTKRETFLKESSKRFDEHIAQIDDTILKVLKAQIAVERCMISILEARGRDPKHYFYTADKIKECKKIEPPIVSKAIWDLFEKCTWVRNELVHSLDEALVKEKSDLVRELYLALTESEVHKQNIRDMNDMQVVTSAFNYCGMHLVLADEIKAATSAQKSVSWRASI
ncbi:hypothetical protein [Bradyrhizobium centrosematis]|uniref:hypothetical protein n=1 Tax=Bradyrhizobium centrosematis TaxID=1300039 RepID=UPI002167D360|nr:hypothetical protein [Bradyrhizobium centrosematis]MCS3761648.1 hypothetical protein [Bradyrhizobium centrosematis]MCS3774316.1 hypothetical protein [Bradyrhizobium centrosematis]